MKPENFKEIFELRITFSPAGSHASVVVLYIKDIAWGFTAGWLLSQKFALLVICLDIFYQLLNICSAKDNEQLRGTSPFVVSRSGSEM